MAVEFRVLDDDQDLKEFFKQTKPPPFGFVIQADGSKTDLHFRDMTNKIMHATSFEWNMTNPENPMVMCYSNQPDRWQCAAIDLLAIMTLVGSLAV